MEWGSPYLSHPVLPAHALQASYSQDNGTELLLLIKLPKPGVEVSPLWRHAKKKPRPTQCTLCPSLFSPSADF